MLRAIAPLPLLAMSGCGDDSGNGAANVVQPRSSPSPSSASSSAAPSPAVSATPRAAAQPEVSDAPAVTDAVALTFHGDGSPALANALLGEAEKSGARLTVLAVGQWLAGYPQMAERVLKGGHELGNHTEHHLNIDTMSVDQAYTEIELCAQRLEQLTGSRGRWFRQSQGQHASAHVRAAATRAGYQTLLSYDLDPVDYRNPGSSTIVRNVLGSVRGGDVVSMHLGHPQTVTALPQILDGLRQRGLRAVTASELFPTVAAGSTPASGSTSQPS